MMGLPLLNSIAQAAGLGYTAEQVLEFVMGRFSRLKEPIKEARKLGHAAEDILEFLSTKKNFKGKNEFEQTQRGLGYTEPGERLQKGIETAKKAAPLALGAAGLALGVRDLFSKSGLSTLGTPKPGPQAPTQPKPPIGQPVQPSTQQAQLAPPAGQATAQTPGPLTPQVPRAPNPKHADLIKQMGVENVIQGLASKEDPATIAQVLEQHFLKPAQKKWLSEQTSEPLQNVIQDYLADRPKEAEVKPGTPGSPTTDLLPEATESVEESEPFNAVLTPSGDIGTLSKEDKGIASIDVDGKQKQFRDQDVIKAPIPEKDIADIYEELIGKIPESERSAVINVAGYDPNHNELIFMPHTGALYVYKDIPPEFAEKLQGAMFKAKTTGENLYGAWAEGESSRFAGLSKLIRELQTLYGGKGKEYVRKYEKIYDFLAVPKAALKDKEKKRREEERARQGKKPRKPRSS